MNKVQQTTQTLSSWNLRDTLFYRILFKSDCCPVGKLKKGQMVCFWNHPVGFFFVLEEEGPPNHTKVSLVKVSPNDSDSLTECLCYLFWIKIHCLNIVFKESIEDTVDNPSSLYVLKMNKGMTYDL